MTHSVRVLPEALMEVAEEYGSVIKRILDVYLIDLVFLRVHILRLREFRREKAERLARVFKEVIRDLI
jgi:hypothetical protein